MANKVLFNNNRTEGNLVKNQAGGEAYQLDSRVALAQLASTGCLSGTFYTSAKDQLNKVKELANNISDNEFIAKLAIYSRKNAFMKDMPALLLSFLAVRDPELYERTFPAVMDNSRMIRNHVQIIRSGQIDGRKSMPRAMRRQLKMWFARRKNDRLFKDTVGNDPSMADVIKMVRPRPQDKEQEALYSYIIGRKPIKGSIFNATSEDLPELVQEYEACKNKICSDENVKIPDVPFQMLDSLQLKDKHWKEIAKNAKWQMTRMNINTFQRHGVFEDKILLNKIANRLRDPKEIKRAKAFPYQLMAAFMNATNAPFDIREALQDAMDVAVDNVPQVPGNVYIFPDVSSSMGSPVTGYGSRRASAVTCIDVAALISATFLKTNRQSKVIPFSTRLDMQMAKKLNPRDSVMTNAQTLKRGGGGGTNVSLGVKYLADTKQDVDLVLYVSDNQSWIGNSFYGKTETSTLNYWDIIKKNNPNAKMVCLDIQPYGTSQAPNRNDIMNIGGFSDIVWDVIAQFAKHGRDGSHWIEAIESVDIPATV